MSKKTEKVVAEKPEKETSMRFEKDWMAPLGKKGIIKQMEKRVKSMPLMMTEKEKEQHEQIMAPKRARRAAHRAAKALEMKMQTKQSQGAVNATV